MSYQKTSHKTSLLIFKPILLQKIQIFKHDAVSLKNSKYSSEDYTGILKVIHYVSTFYP